MPEPIKSLNLGSWFENQFHQVAMYTSWPEFALNYWRARGFNDWIHDEAELRGYITDPRTGMTVPSCVEAEMNFNYSIMPMELEFLTYHGGTSRHSLVGNDNPGEPFISHMSVYVTDVMAEIKANQLRFGTLPYHRFVTQNHTNPGVVGKKRFIEAIFDTKALLGYDVKLIEKVPWDFDDLSYLHHDIFEDWQSVSANAQFK